MIRYFTLALALFWASAYSLQAQTPRSVVSNQTAAPESVCPPGQQNQAGTVSLGAINASSNDIDLDTMYLCLGDEVEIIHNGDFNLSGDPNAITPAGIGYAFYDCPPTISGPDQTTIGADPCLVTNPPPTGLYYVATDGNLNGDILFFNDGTLVDFFNAGNPALYWFAPITFDALFTNIIGPDTIYQAQYENGGPCVDATVGAAIPVVYLNAIEATNIITGGGATGCIGSFDIAGGLPEFDGSNYTIAIELAGNPGVQGVVFSGPATHGDLVEFLVPQAGLYNVTISDDKSCPESFSVNIGTCTAVGLTIPEVTALTGDNVCLDITVANFNTIQAMQFTILFDPTIVNVTAIQNFNPTLFGFNAGSFNTVGNAIVCSWNDFDPLGASLADGDVLFQICFDVIGTIGDCSPVAFSNTPVVIEFIADLIIIDFLGDNGEICIFNPTLTVDLQTTDVSCVGNNDGSFTATVSDGATPFQVSWQDTGGGPVQGPGIINTQGGSFTANGLAPGTYSVTITDSGPAADFITDITIQEGPALNVIFNSVAPLCNGGTGSLTALPVLDSVIISNPGPEYTFLWSNMGMTQSISGITSGLFSVTVTNTLNGCTTTGTTFLPQTPPIAVSVDNVTNASCSGFSDGTITVSASGGTPILGGNYQFFWPSIGLTEVAPTSTASNLAAGTYTVEVTDNNGCTVQTQIQVDNQKTLTIQTIDLQEISCNGVCDGEITVQASTQGGASAFYVFNWAGTPAPPPPFNTAFTSTVSGLCAGNYTLTVFDDQGCSEDTSFPMPEPPVLSASLLSQTDETCTTGSDGTATLAVTGGVYPYTYDWGVAGQTDSTATGLVANSYEVTVTDVNGCIDLVNVTIDAPNPPVIQTFADVALPCFDSADGSLTVVAIPGSGAITDYSWSNGPSGPAVTTINGLLPGNYCVTITDASGCTVVDCADVTAPAALTLDSIQTTTPLCPGLSGGSASVFVSGGTGPYFYDWTIDFFDGIGNAAIAGGLVTAGDYSVTITDANNCTPLVVDITVEDPPTIQAIFNNIDSVSCFANQGVPCDGTATALANYSDGTSGVFNFLWPSGESDFGVASSTAVQLCQGSQTVVISDGICSIEADVLIPFPEPLGLANLTVEDVTCAGAEDGSATLTASGGTLPYVFSWSNGQTGPTQNNLGPDNYTVTISDAKGCLFQTSFPIDEPPPLVAFLDPQSTIDTVTCFGDSDGAVSVTAQGGNLNINPALNFNWQGGIGSPNSGLATNLSAGTYSVTVSDFLGCSDVLAFTIFEPTPIQFELGPIEPIPCAGFTTNITVDTAFGGNGFANFWYSFAVGNATSQPLGTPIEVFGGNITVTVYDFEGCSVDTVIFLPEPPPILLEYPDVIVVELGDSVRIEPTLFQSQFPINPDSVFWTPLTFLRFDGNSLEPVVRPLEDQEYIILAFDANGCPVEARTFVEVDKNRNVFIPNIFTPDGDGINDIFSVYTGNGVAFIHSFRIFDRWGEMVFERTDLDPTPFPDPLNSWDGTFRGRNMNPGVYVFLIEVEFEDGERLYYRGDITLIR